MYHSSASISNNIISYNIDHNDGGGINLELYSEATIANNTIDCNGSGGICSGEGTGIAMYKSDCIIRNNVISNSRSGTGIDDRQEGGEESRPTVMYNNSWNNPCGNYVDLSSSTGENTKTNFNGDSCDTYYNISFDPMFADTITYALPCSSACIDAGDLTSEIRGGGGRRIDIGAYEYPYVIGNTDQNGEVNIVDVVYLLNYLFKNGPYPCPLGKGDVDCNSLVDLVDAVYLINYLFRAGRPPCF